ncbi:hypothetical protein L6639_42270 [Bradyrhizobium sp. WYCCWR 12678]|nr:hypothetical protein [Bradyrhizobium zhengyangense]MCG2645742.1 hypothetical protein [Bradyrhizobium zhengyangense]
MLSRVFVAFVLIVFGSTVSEARRLPAIHQVRECNVIMPCDFSLSQPHQIYNTRRLQALQRGNALMSYPSVTVGNGQVVGHRPAGCPRNFCGCGASIKVFGRIVPELNLASNWLRFPRAAPAPGMVAARHGHVFVLEQHVNGDVWMAYDANSGGHATRVHERSIRGYTVVNPRA